MKKQILNLGKALSKVEQTQINAGFGSTCSGTISYPVGTCTQCVNKITPGGPVFCYNNCCVQAY